MPVNGVKPVSFSITHFESKVYIYGKLIKTFHKEGFAKNARVYACKVRDEMFLDLSFIEYIIFGDLT